jgi:hypothetical protein
LYAKENRGILTSADGTSTYKTAFTKGGLDADTPGAGKTTTIIMHIINSLNKMDELFERCGEAPAYKPTVVVVPPISIDQWINDFRNNAPTVNLLIYWGSKGDKKDSWWIEHHISSKDFADGPEKAVLATSEVIPSRSSPGGRLWHQLASRGIDRGAQLVTAYLFALILSLCSSYNCRPRCRQSWTLIPTPIQAYALDTLFYPTMSTECERVFSSAKKLLAPERNTLSEGIIEACQCLKAWWKKDLIQQHE